MDIFGIKIKNVLFPVSIFIMTVFLIGCGPKNYDECILENAKGISDKDVMFQIEMACMNKFPEKSEASSCNPSELDLIQKQKIQFSDVSVGPTKYLRVPFYNGNEDIDIREMYVTLESDNLQAPQKYKLYVGVVSPLQSGSGGTEVAQIPTQGWSFSVNSVKGCKAK